MTIYDELQGGPHYFEFEIDCHALTVTVTESGQEHQHTTFKTWEALCDGYPALWQGVLDAHNELAEALSWEDEPPAPVDLRSALVTTKRRAEAHEAADTSTWSATLARVEEVVLSFDDEKASTKRLPKQIRRDVDLSPTALWESLESCIAIERLDGAIPLGASKVGGLPHLPPDFEWPVINGQPTYLIVQLDLAEVSAADLRGVVPGTGTLYVFATEASARVLRYIPSGALEPRAYPFPVPSYMQSTVDHAHRLAFKPAFYFSQTSDTYGPSAIAKALPKAFLARIISAFGHDVIEAGDAWGGDRIFGGDPIDWQAMGESYLDNELFAQICYADGHVSIGVHRDDLRIAFFDDADVGYCGT